MDGGQPQRLGFLAGGLRRGARPVPGKTILQRGLSHALQLLPELG